MELIFPNESRSFDVTRGAVRFWGYQSSIECSFFVTVTALRRLQADLQPDEARSYEIIVTDL